MSHVDLKQPSRIQQKKVISTRQHKGFAKTHIVLAFRSDYALLSKGYNQIDKALVPSRFSKS